MSILVTCPRCGSSFASTATTNTRCRSCRAVVQIGRKATRSSAPTAAEADGAAEDRSSAPTADRVVHDGAAEDRASHDGATDVVAAVVLALVVVAVVAVAWTSWRRRHTGAGAPLTPTDEELPDTGEPPGPPDQA